MVRRIGGRGIIPSLFLKIALYSAMVNIILTPLNTSLASVFGYLTIIAFALYPVTTTIFSKRLYPWLAVFAILIFISCLMSWEYYQADELRKNIIAAMSFLLFYWSISIDHTRCSVTLNDLFVVSLLLSLTFLVYTFGNFSFTYTTSEEYGIHVFTMGLGNPNAVAGYVMFTIMVFLIRTFAEKNWLKIIPLLILILGMGYILIRLSSRTVLLCAIMAVFFALFRKKRWISRVSTVLAMIVPFAVIPFWATSSTENITQMVLGKVIATGRETIYAELLQDLSRNPQNLLFGQFFRYPFSNMHNGPLTIVATIGIIGLICYIVFWILELKTLRKQSDTPLRNGAYCFVLLYIIQSSMEAMSVAGTIPYSVFALLIIQVARGQITASPQKRSNKNELSARKRI